MAIIVCLMMKTSYREIRVAILVLVKGALKGQNCKPPDCCTPLSALSFSANIINAIPEKSLPAGNECLDKIQLSEEQSREVRSQWCWSPGRDRCMLEVNDWL
ncbi:unnamed protein product [Caretta caretta]